MLRTHHPDNPFHTAPDHVRLKAVYQALKADIQASLAQAGGTLPIGDAMHLAEAHGIHRETFPALVERLATDHAARLDRTPGNMRLVALGAKPATTAPATTELLGALASAALELQDTADSGIPVVRDPVAPAVLRWAKKTGLPPIHARPLVGRVLAPWAVEAIREPFERATAAPTATDPLEARLLDIIASAGESGLTASKLYGRMSGYAPRREIDAAADRLAKAERIVSRKATTLVGGRPSTRYFAT